MVHGLDEPSYAGRALANAPDTGVRDRGGGSATALAGHIGSATLGLSAALSGISGFSMASLPGPILTGYT
jgi:hypothetical protein